MKDASASVLVYSIYLTGIGTFFLFFPNILLSMDRVSSNEVLISMVGFLFLVGASYVFRLFQAAPLTKGLSVEENIKNTIKHLFLGEGRGGCLISTNLYLGIFMLIIGLGLCFEPTLSWSKTDLPTSDYFPVRVIGVCLLVLAYVYIRIAFGENRNVLQWTVYARILTAAGFLIFYTNGWHDPVLILFGVIDILGAIWTQLAIRSSEVPLS